MCGIFSLRSQINLFFLHRVAWILIKGIIRALIQRIDVLTVTTESKLKKLINTMRYHHMPIFNDAKKECAWKVEVN